MTGYPLFSIEYHILIAAFELFTLAESFLPISRISAQMHIILATEAQRTQKKQGLGRVFLKTYLPKH